MSQIWQGLVRAVELIISRDPEVIEIAVRSLTLAALSLLFGILIFLPLGCVIHFNNFRGKRGLINIVQTLYSVPTVVVGLLVFLFISSAGPFGPLGLLFTPSAIVIGQTLLIAPIVVGLTVAALSGIDKNVNETAKSLGANTFQYISLVIREARFAILSLVILAFGRAISEVGVALMVGGNIRGFTRTFTTAISLETSRGEVELSIALGILLLAVAFIVSLLFNLIQHRRE